MVAGLDEGWQRGLGGYSEAKISECLYDLDLCSCIDIGVAGGTTNIRQTSILVFEDAIRIRWLGKIRPVSTLI